MKKRSHRIAPASPSRAPLTRSDRPWAAPAARLVLLCGLLAGGCASPVVPRDEEDLRQSVIDSARRELEHARTSPDPLQTTRENTADRLEIDPRFMPELQQMTAYDPLQFDVGPDLLGQPQRTASISLERAIRTAVNNNLETQFARLGPAISQSQVVAAEAAFDWTFFSNSQYGRVDEPRTVTRQGFSTFGSGSTRQNVASNTTGLRRLLTSGGSFTVQQELSITDDFTPGQSIEPNPATNIALTAQLDQPLLRGFGSEVTLSQVRLARNDERDAIASLKQTLIRTVTDTEQAYWQLYQAHRTLLIRQRHLEEGIKTREYVRVRWKQVQDANEAQFADSVSRVESRLTALNSARRAFQVASDQLKALINDPDLTLGADVLIIPADAALDVPVQYSLADLLGTALTSRPEVDQAINSIDNTSIRLDVANNARLPKLDLRLQTKLSGLDHSVGGAYSDIVDGSFISALAGLNFEAPIGNRGPESLFRRRVEERLQATIAYRNTLQGITLQVISALRGLTTAYGQIEQTRNARLAAANSYRAFKVEKIIRLPNDVDTLNTEFQRQDALAQAELEELAALAGYNIAIAQLYAAAGTALEHNRIEFVVPDVGTPPQRSRRTADQSED
jgi:outer membrane protein TolC